MLRTLFVEFLLPLLLFWLLRSVIRSFFHTAPQPQTPVRPSRPSVQQGGELKKDPVCGTYVSTAASLTRTVNGEVLHFCSKECRDKYRAA
jgi:YHS domain-containing protein